MSKKKPAPKRSSKKTEQVKELTDDLQRIQADFANHKRRCDEDKKTMVDFGRADMVKQLMPVLDNIDRALSHVPSDLMSNEWVQGVVKIDEQLVKELDKLGVKKVPTVDQEFNPELHEAVSVEDGEGDKEVIAEELQAGYTYKDTVIRPAYVKVKRVRVKENK